MKIAILFPGYTSQFVGMAKELYDEHRIVQEYFEEASNCLSSNFVKLCFASSEADLSKAEHAYSALFLVSSSIAALLKQEGITPDLVAGYHVGQIGAIHAAGGLSFPDGLYFLTKYAQFYHELVSHDLFRVAAVNMLPIDKIIETIHPDNKALGLAAVIDHNHAVIAGEVSLMEQALSALKTQKARIAEINNAYGIHSWVMSPVVEQLHVYVQKVDFHTTTIPVCMTTDGQLVNEGALLKNGAIEQMRKTIHFDYVMRAIAPYDCIIEVGPGNMITDLIMRAYPEKKAYAINRPADVAQVMALMKNNHE